MTQKQFGILSFPVIVAALGYFVDIYDLLLFSIIRIPSLRSLGLNDEQIAKQGLFIINIQMIGLLVGGIIWGILGDKKGRLKVLYASIILYSIGNIANGFVQTVDQYALVRFITGIGLAGELGAGITLVSELLPKEKRGIGTSMVAGIGLTGAVVAFFLKEEFPWRTCYFIVAARWSFGIRHVQEHSVRKCLQRKLFNAFFQWKTLEKILEFYSYWPPNMVCDRDTHYFFQRVWEKHGNTWND